MSWKPEQKVQGAWYPNGQAFATEKEAAASAYSRFMRWTMSEDSRAVESEEPVNYRFDSELGDVMLESEKRDAS